MRKAGEFGSGEGQKKWQILHERWKEGNGEDATAMEFSKEKKIGLDLEAKIRGKPCLPASLGTTKIWRKNLADIKFRT